jgi:hypothetical protein
MKKKALLYIFLLVALLALALYRNGCFRLDRNSTNASRERSIENDGKGGPSPERPGRREEFDRNTSRIIYTKHARCRMGCRHIDESEVREVLQNGKINYEKSDLRAHPDPKYALEGNTKDGQHVRIIFAPSPRGMVVITVIDLAKEWTCDCD